MTVHVEPAALADVDRVADMWTALADEQRSHGSHLMAAENHEAIARTMVRHAVDDELLVARKDGETVGFVSFEVESGGFARSVTRGIVQNVYVVPDQREQGVGTALLDAAEDALAERDAEVISIEALAANDAARRLYQRRGYDPYRIEFERPVETDNHSRPDG